MTGKKQKFLFVYLKTGGGHYAPAKAVSDYINNHMGENAEAVLADGLEKSIWLARLIILDSYRFLQNRAKWIFELIYAVHKLKSFSYLSAFLASINTEKYIEETILKELPDKILIFHFLLIDPVYKVLKKHNLEIPVTTLVTDPYSAPLLWYLKKDQNFILFSGLLKDRLIRYGVDEKNIRVFNFTLDEKYSRCASPEEIIQYKMKHGFKKEKVLLILGGGDGIPRGIQILKNILKSSRSFEIAFVCGNNKAMYNEAVKLKKKPGSDDLKIYGYVDFVHELISSADLVITKCGASTFMQILLSKKIPVVNSYIWEQEKGNVDFLVENNLGVFEKRIDKLSVVIDNLLFRNEALAVYKNNIERAGLKNGTADVAGYIVSSK